MRVTRITPALLDDPDDDDRVAQEQPEHEVDRDDAERRCAARRRRRRPASRTRSSRRSRPGPASSGVPSGTSATLTSGLDGSSARPVSSSSATSRSSRPPGDLHRRQRDAEVVEDPLAEQRERRDDDERDEDRLAGELACASRWLRPLVRPRNSGIVPGGSMMTNSVTKTSTASLTSPALMPVRPAARLREHAPRTPPGRWCTRRAGSSCRCRGSRSRRSRAGRGGAASARSRSRASGGLSRWSTSSPASPAAAISSITSSSTVRPRSVAPGARRRARRRPRAPAARLATAST